ncbi:MAG: molybdopterin cofactor-binding domain-containing protein [Verrucomicrobiota bacterium]
MPDREDNITPFELPNSLRSGEGRSSSESGTRPTGETFGERLRRRRSELEGETGQPDKGSWSARLRHQFALVVESPHASASIARKSRDAARAVPGVTEVLFAEHIPAFQNQLGPDFSDEPLLAADEVCYFGQPVAIVVAESEGAACRGVEALEIEYHDRPGILDLEHAMARGDYHDADCVCSRGDVGAAMQGSQQRFDGEFSISSQLPDFPSESAIVIRSSENGRRLAVQVTALHPSLVRSAVARAANLPESRVSLEVPPLTGPNSARIWEPVRLAALATQAALKLDDGELILKPYRSDSPLLRGERHEAHARYVAAVDDRGILRGLDLVITLDGGYFPGQSATALDRALLHADGVYGIENCRIKARLAQSNRILSGPLPAEGSAQGSWIIEEVMRRIAGHLGTKSPLFRERHFYREAGDISTSPSGQQVDPGSIHRVWHYAKKRGDIESRRAEIDRWNRSAASHKRGLGLVAVKYGIGDPRADRNSATVLLQILGDGSVQVRTGLVDLGDGLELQIREETATRLGVDTDQVDVVFNDFELVPRATSAVGTDAAGLVINAIDRASQPLLDRLREVALQLFAARGQTDVERESIRFKRGLVEPNPNPEAPLYFTEVVEGAWAKRVCLVEAGFFRSPNLWWDRRIGAGWPFSSFTHAAALVEVEVDTFTGEVQVLRVDVAHEGSPTEAQGERDLALLYRGFSLGMGWQLSETVPVTNADDFHGSGKPGFADAPMLFFSDRLRPRLSGLAAPGSPCSESPVLLASGVREAVCDAFGAFGMEPDSDIEIPFPLTPPAVLATLRSISLANSEQGDEAGDRSSTRKSPAGSGASPAQDLRKKLDFPDFNDDEL